MSIPKQYTPPRYLQHDADEALFSASGFGSGIACRIDVFPIDDLTNGQAFALEVAIEGALGRTWDETDYFGNHGLCVYRVDCSTETEALQVARLLQVIQYVGVVRVQRVTRSLGGVSNN
ncbi:MAG: hypothetical protein WCI73_06445 [Phycisphaerae bacterium]